MSLPFQTYTIAQQLLLACLSVAPDEERLASLLNKSPDWEELLNQGLRHGVQPLLYQALKHQLPVEVLDRLRSFFAAHTMRSLQMQKEMQRLIGLLNDKGIAVIPYKGPVLAVEAYGDVALRSFNDIDLLVPGEQAWVSVKILLEQGYWLDIDLPEDRWASLQRVDNHLFLHHPDHDWGVEIHWDLFHPMYGLPFDLSLHWAALDGGKEGRLKSEELLVLLCAHGAKHCWEQLKWLVDIDRLVRSDMPIRWEQVVLTANGAGSFRALLVGLNLSKELLGTPLWEKLSVDIEADDVARELAKDVVDHLFPEDPEQRQSIREYTFYLRTRDNRADRLKQVLRWLFFPRQADWEAFPLGARYLWLYYVERPIRMAWKHLLKRFFK